MPARIDRDAFQRVLQRAAELQVRRQEVGDTLSEDEVLELGREVGLSESSLRQALVESRMELVMPHADGIVDRAVAPATITAERVVQGEAEEIGTALGTWFEREELLVVQRSTPTRVTWEHLDSFAGAMRKVKAAFDPNRGPAYLERAQLVTAVLMPLEDGYTHVTLIASLERTRTGYLAGGSAIGFVGTAGAGVLAVIGAPVILPLLAVVPAFGIGYLIARAFRRVAERAQVGLQRALDRIEREPLALPSGADRPPPRRAIAQDIGRAVRDITVEVRKAIEEGKRR